MGVLKKTSFPENLEKYNVFIIDNAVDSKYFKITELEQVFTGGKNAFLIQGTPNFVPGTAVKLEIKDSIGNVIYTEPGEGIPEYYEGVSKPVAVYVYPDTAFGECTLTILGELATYDSNGSTVPVPAQWQNKYNVKWQKKIMVNPFLANTTKIRFYRRPQVEITETVLPISTATISRYTISGSIAGTAIEPSANTDFRVFAGDTIYELLTTGSVFSSSMEGETISVSGLTQAYSTVVKDVVNSKKLLATIPYYETQSNGFQTVKSFVSGAFQLTYTSNTSYVDSALNASYAKIKLTDMQAFSGDPARLKIYARRKASIATTYTLLEDILLESDDKLLVDSYSGSINVSTGIFSNQSVINDFWKYRDYSSPSTFYSTPYNNDIAAASVILAESDTKNSTVYPQRLFYYSASIDFLKTTEYQLDFTPILSSSLFSPNKLEIYASGSAFVSTDASIRLGKKIGTIQSDNTFTKYDIQQINFNPDSDGTGYLMFAVHQGNWNLSNISLRASSETAFSPNEITVNVSMPTILADDTYEFKFEFYDINNKFVPVTVTAEHTFTGGTDLTGLGGGSGTGESFFMQPDSTIFSFGWDNTYDFSEIFTSKPRPIAGERIGILVQQNGYTGSTGILITSQAFDSDNNYITPAAYTGYQYPGTLTSVDATNYYLSVENFTGALDASIDVKRVAYTASLIGITPTVKDVFNIYKVIEGTPGSDGADGTQYIIKPINGTAIKNSNPSQLLEVQLTKIESGSLLSVSSGNVKLVTGSNTIVNAGNGVTAGANGVNYNAIFSATKISGSLVVGAYNFDTNTLVDTITLADITDGITTGYIEASKGLILKRNPNNSNVFNPTTTALTASFYDNFGTQYTASILVTPSYTTADRLEYSIGLTNPNISTVQVRTTEGATMSAATPANTKGLVATWTFTEPISNQTITVSEGVSIAVDGAIFNVFVSNENASLPASSNGFVASSSFLATTGSISVKYGNSSISYASPISNNTFSASIYATSSVSGAQVIPTTQQYFIQQLTADAGSMTVRVIYRDSDAIESTIDRDITYSKSKAGESGVSGSSGSVGPGVVFVGSCESLASTWTWESNSTTRHITSDDLEPRTYYSLLSAANGLTKTATGCPPNATYFSALTNFAAVATDILLAQDANITRTLVMGQYTGSISTTGIIRSAQASSILSGNGFYLAASDPAQFRVGNPSTNYLLWDGDSLILKGEVQADSGRIGNWEIETTGVYSGSLIDTNQTIVLDPVQKEIAINSGSVPVKVISINPNQLTDLATANEAYTPTNTSTIASTLISTTSGSDWVSSGEVYGGVAPGLNGSVLIDREGIYRIVGISTLSSFNIDDLSTAGYTLNDNWNNSGDYNSVTQASRQSWWTAGETIFSGVYYPRTLEATLYIQAVRTDTNAIVSTQFVETVSTTEKYKISNRAELYESSPGNYDWNPLSDTTYAGTYENGTRSETVSPISMTLPAANIGFRYVVVIMAKSGYWQDLNTTGRLPNYKAAVYKTITNKGVSTFGSSTGFSVDVPVNITELTAGGLQIASSAASYVKIQRYDSVGGASSSDLVTVAGGKVVVYNSAGSGGGYQSTSGAEQLLTIYGRADFGYVNVVGDLVANSSDSRFKSNITIIPNALDKVNSIDGVYFNWNDTANVLMGKSTSSIEVGFLAQQVQAVLPEIVKLAPIDTNREGKSISGKEYLTIQYEKIVPLLVEAIKELKREVDDLKNR